MPGGQCFCSPLLAVVEAILWAQRHASARDPYAAIDYDCLFCNAICIMPLCSTGMLWHPGVTRNDVSASRHVRSLRHMFDALWSPAEDGAQTVVHAATVNWDHEKTHMADLKGPETDLRWDMCCAATAQNADNIKVQYYT